MDSLVSSRKDAHSPANERLRRAIERNRQKQLRREGQAPTGPSPGQRPLGRPSPVRALPQGGPIGQQQGEPLAQRPQSHLGNLRPRPQGQIHRPMAAGARVASPRTLSPVQGQKVLGVTQKMAAPKKSRWYSLLYKGLWLFHGYLLVQLAISPGGAVDYYEKVSLLQSRHYHLESIEHENGVLEEEIELVSTNEAQQKELIRKHLGLIARDEYLVLFARGK